MSKQYLLASDFDQTLSFNDSGHVLSDLLCTSGFSQKVAGLSRMSLVQPGGELAYLILHDPEYRRVRREHLLEVGRRVRMKRNIPLLARLLEQGLEGHRFAFHVVSAAPEEVVQAALEGIVPPENIHGTCFRYAESGEVESIVRVPAGYGKVVVIEELRARLQVSPPHVIYVGDGSSDMHAMLHVNQRDGFTIAVSDARFIAPIARRTVLSDDALSVLVPILEEIVGWGPGRIRGLFEAQGLLIHEWDKVRTDRVTIHGPGAASA